MNETLFDLVFHHITKFIGGLVLLYVWWAWASKSVVPWWTASDGEGESSSTTAKDFPVASLLVMIAISFGYVYYVQMEHAYRETNTIQSDFADKEQQKIRDLVESYEPAAP